jgi:hypothetical protein
MSAPASRSPLSSATRRPADGPGFTPREGTDGRAPALLRRSGRLVLAALLLAQGVFAAYLLASYGRTTLAGDMAAWARLSATGWVPGDTVGNGAMAVHVGVAVLVLLAGGLQLVPVVRRRWPAVHRWSGRVYLTGCAIGAVSGLSLVWGRGTVGDRSQHMAISINAALLLGCAVMAGRTARRRAFAAHEAWAIRTMLAASGVLFFRLFLALWLLVFRAPVGFDPRTFSGPFLTTLAFTAYVFGPLGVCEGYRLAARSRHPARQRLVAGGLSVLAAACVAGTAAAALVLWGPKLR